MLGTFRYILASAVVAGHIFVESKFRIEVAALVNFFVVSGYVLTLLVRRDYWSLRKHALCFYADRLLRIFPQFFFYLVITQICVLLVPFHFYKPNFNSEFHLGFFLLNALVVPLNFYFLFPEFYRYALIPPAWSLALEVQLYCLFPALLLNKWAGRIATAVSAAIFLVAGVGEVLHSRLWGFRFLPGVLFMFMIGKNLAEIRGRKNNESLLTLSALYAMCLTMLGWILSRPVPSDFFCLNTLVGLVVGLPIIAVLVQFRRKTWDDLIGNCSYGVFLNHMLVLNLLIHIGIFPRDHFKAFSVGLIVSTFAALFSYWLVEKPISKFRMRLRRELNQPTQVS